jgi:hypothetical protein
MYLLESGNQAERASDAKYETDTPLRDRFANLEVATAALLTHMIRHQTAINADKDDITDLRVCGHQFMGNLPYIVSHLADCDDALIAIAEATSDDEDSRINANDASRRFDQPNRAEQVRSSQQKMSDRVVNDDQDSSSLDSSESESDVTYGETIDLITV